MNIATVLRVFKNSSLIHVEIAETEEENGIIAVKFIAHYFPAEEKLRVAFKQFQRFFAQ
jgi:hypothetical protein